MIEVAAFQAKNYGLNPTMKIYDYELADKKKIDRNSNAYSTQQICQCPLQSP